MQHLNTSSQSKDNQNDSNFSLADFMNNTNLNDSGLFGTLNFNNLSTPQQKQSEKEKLSNEASAFAKKNPFNRSKPVEQQQPMPFSNIVSPIPKEVPDNSLYSQQTNSIR